MTAELTKEQITALKERAEKLKADMAKLGIKINYMIFPYEIMLSVDLETLVKAFGRNSPGIDIIYKIVNDKYLLVVMR